MTGGGGVAFSTGKLTLFTFPLSTSNASGVDSGEYCLGGGFSGGVILYPLGGGNSGTGAKGPVGTLLITAAGMGGGDNVLRENGPGGGAERRGGGEGDCECDCIALTIPVESSAPLPMVICGDIELLSRGGGEVFPGGGGGCEKGKEFSVGVVPK